jgi:VanZ family protein
MSSGRRCLEAWRLKPVFVPTVRYPRAWFLVGLVLAALTTFTSLLPPSQLPHLGISDKLQHGVGYALLGFWFASVIARRDYIFILLALIALGGGIEIAQGLMGMGRQADLGDFAANAVGAAAGIGIALTPLGRWVGVLEQRLPRRLE